jgi:hypothetical protein
MQDLKKFMRRARELKTHRLFGKIVEKLNFKTIMKISVTIEGD